MPRKVDVPRELVEVYVQKIMDDEDIERFCDRFARGQSGTKFMDLETIEESPQGQLYWAEYAIAQSAVVLEVFKRVLNI